MQPPQVRRAQAKTTSVAPQTVRLCLPSLRTAVKVYPQAHIPEPPHLQPQPATMDTLLSAIGLCAKIYQMCGTFTSNKGQCEWLLSKVKNIQHVLEEQLARGALPETLMDPLVVLEEDLRASKTVLEEFGRCKAVMRFLVGSKHAKQFLEAGDRLATSYTTLCHAVSIHLALNERDHAARRDEQVNEKLQLIMQKLDSRPKIDDADFQFAFQRDAQECEADLVKSMLDPELSAKLRGLGVRSNAGNFTRDLSASARSIVTVEDAQSCSWCMRSDELAFDYREVKKGQPAKEIRLGKPGSFGDVFSATHCDRTLVAVKKLKIPTKTNDLVSSASAAAAFAAFVKEVSFAFSLKHPNIVRTLGGVVDHQEEPPCWIIMERLNMSLAEVMYSTFVFVTDSLCDFWSTDPPRHESKNRP
jgi:hypothetical protein